MRYLGVIIMRSRAFKCSPHHAKKLFYRSSNAIFGEIGRIFRKLFKTQVILILSSIVKSVFHLICHNAKRFVAKTCN